MKRPLSDLSVQVSPSWASQQFDYETETLGAVSSESPLSAATPGPASKLARLAGGEGDAFAVQAMPRARPPTTLAQLAREVLTLQSLPYEARAAAVASWLRRARCLGDAQYHECVQLAVSLLTRRAAKDPPHSNAPAAAHGGIVDALDGHGATYTERRGVSVPPLITLDDLGASSTFDGIAQAQCHRAMREGPFDGGVSSRGPELFLRGAPASSPAPDPLAFFFADAGAAASTSRVGISDISPVSSFEMTVAPAAFAERPAAAPPAPAPGDTGVTLDLLTGEASYEPPTRRPLCHVASDTSQFRRAVRAHDPLDGGEMPGDVMQQLSAWCSSGQLPEF